MERIAVSGLAVSGLVVAVGLGVAAVPAAAQPPACPRGYDVGLLSLDEGVDLLVGQGVPAPEDDVLARLSSFDRDGDGSLCFKDLPDTEGIAVYSYQYKDDLRR